MASFDFLKKKSSEKSSKKPAAEKAPQEEEIPKQEESTKNIAEESLFTDLPDFPSAANEINMNLPEFDKQDFEDRELRQSKKKDKKDEKKQEHEQRLPPGLREYEESNANDEDDEIESIPKPEKKILEDESSIFMSAKDYKFVLSDISSSDRLLDQSIRLAIKINDIKIEDDEKLKALYESLSGLHQKIIAIDNKLSKN